ncbi:MULTISPECIES: hypothetical protein [Rhizobium]|nr:MULTISPECIES: hypothetical protein [Rhizobium]WFU88713.1 hypothetical protein QA644_06515 [Rhizobium sp. CC1099]
MRPKRGVRRGVLAKANRQIALLASLAALLFLCAVALETLILD